MTQVASCLSAETEEPIIAILSVVFIEVFLETAPQKSSL